MRNLKSSGGLTHGGMRSELTTAQRHQWVLSMPLCAGMNRAMQHLTGVKYRSSEQHQEMGASRQERDSSDALKLLKFLKNRNPFDGSAFRNIDTGELADNRVNVDNAYNIGSAILAKMVGQQVYQYSYTRPKDYSYNQLCTLYCDYLIIRYGKPTVVFDGYMNGPNIKDSTHSRRSKKTGKDILFQPEMKISGKKDEFLTNEFNKQRFINLLSQMLINSGINVLHAISVADTLIVETAIKLAKQKDACIIGSDTDLLILSVNSVYKSNNLTKLYIRS